MARLLAQHNQTKRERIRNALTDSDRQALRRIGQECVAIKGALCRFADALDRAGEDGKGLDAKPKT